MGHSWFISCFQGGCQWFDCTNPKGIFSRLEAKAGMWGAWYLVPGKEQLHRIRSQRVLTWFAFTLTPVFRHLSYLLLRLLRWDFPLKKKKSCRGHLYFSCWDGNITIYPWVNLSAKFWEYHAACCYTKVVHPWPALKETKNIFSFSFFVLFCFSGWGKDNTWGREGDRLSLPHLSEPG